jgi:hypothetical protein
MRADSSAFFRAFHFAQRAIQFVIIISFEFLGYKTSLSFFDMKSPSENRGLVVFERFFLTFCNQADDQREPAAFVERLQRSIQLILIQ